MRCSVCITLKGEEGSIGILLDSLLNQSKKPDEIIIVDGGSKDKSVEIINHYQKKATYIKLLKEKCNRARGRNLGVEIARNEIIAITDAGCVPDRYWLERITEPFRIEKVDIVAGFYKMVGNTPSQRAMGVYLGVLPSKFDVNFLPSTRSIAFRKRVWEEIGGFPEEAGNSAEDTYFNYWALKLGMKYARVKNAVVEWGMPYSLTEFFKKIRDYAKWDAKTKIFLFPSKGLMSHNIKALFVILRYIAGLILLILSFTYPLLIWILLIGLTSYLFLAYKKARFWGIILQFVCDFAVIIGFVNGIFKNGV